MNLKNSLFIFVILFFVNSCFSQKTQNVDDNDNYEDLQRKLAEIVSQEIYAKEYAKKYEKHIKDKARRQVRRTVFNESKDHVKNKVYNKNKPLIWDSLHNKVFIYKTPAWPFYTQPFMQRNIFQVNFDFDFATQSFGSGGEKQDLSVLLFGKSDIKLSDILLAARLMKEDKIYWQPAPQAQPVAYYNPLHYYYILANQALDFDASYDKQSLNLNLARHFHEGDCTLGLQLPFVRRHNSIKLTSDISAADQKTLQDAVYAPAQICPADPLALPGPDFMERYGSLENFLIDILDAKGIKLNSSDTETGIGDLSLFLNAEFDWREAERVFAGVNFIMPTAKKINTNKLWDPELGHGGFYYLEFFGSVLFSENRWFNPHLFVSALFGLPAKVNRRVPEYISYDGVTPADGMPINDLLLSPKQQIYALGANGVFTNEPDSTVRLFSDTVQKVKITHRPEFLFRIGNMFERFISRNGFFDIYYDLSFRAKDYISHDFDSTKYNASVLTDSTWFISNKIGVAYNYQVDDKFRFNLGFQYTFAGVNIEELFKLNLNLSFEF
ncbi:MAG: hypothetical protein SZ59_C0001G0197 [candidate division TM6 bacterium GW2011_GWF2_28_16]|nr:MAG: hypothetical protein SZ59_C0001G0197 [candidate division TM6 bacterium GW2011_GWF2_28_16]